MRAGVTDLGTTYYVSKQGDDVHGMGTKDNPWRTIQMAAISMTAGDTCIILGGIYRETVIPCNSGLSSNVITFRAAKGEVVTICGTDKIASRWDKVSDEVYKCNIDLELGDGNQVFIDHQPMMEARWPSATGDDFFFRPNLAVMDPESAKTSLFDASMPEMDLVGAKMWTTPRRGHGWCAWTSPVLSHKNGLIEVNDNSMWSPQCDLAVSNEYYLFGKVDFLDNEREWFYDENTNELYLYPPKDINALGNNICVKKRTIGVDLSGKSHINLENINLFACTLTMDDETSNCVIDRMSAKYMSHYSNADVKGGGQGEKTGIIISGKNNEIKNSEISFSSGNGIVVSGSNHTVINNYIHDVDYMGVYCAALLLRGADRCIISHNTMTRAGRSLIYATRLNNCKIQYNDLSEPGLLVGDVGALYFGFQEGGNTEISHNIVHHCNGNEGIYLDNGCSNFIVHHNVSIGTPMRYNIPQEYTLVYNNTLDGSILGYYTSKHPNDGIGSRVENNIATGLAYGCSEFVYINNLDSSSPGFKSETDYRLCASSKAINKGLVIDGITSGYKGHAPDLGAYEYGAGDWKAGHDFDNEPNTVFSEVNTPRMNRIKNGGFEHNGFDCWETSGLENSITKGNGTEWHGINGWIRTGRYAAKMGEGINEISQVIFDLIPNATYRVTAWVKVDNGEMAEVKVCGHGSEKVVVTQDYTDNWVRREVFFAIKSDTYKVTLTLSKISSGPYNVYWDDIGLQFIELN